MRYTTLPQVGVFMAELEIEPLKVWKRCNAFIRSPLQAALPRPQRAGGAPVAAGRGDVRGHLRGGPRRVLRGCARRGPRTAGHVG